MVKSPLIPPKSLLSLGPLPLEFSAVNSILLFIFAVVYQQEYNLSFSCTYAPYLAFVLYEHTECILSSILGIPYACRTYIVSDVWIAAGCKYYTTLHKTYSLYMSNLNKHGLLYTKLSLQSFRSRYDRSAYAGKHNVRVPLEFCNVR